jgi:hypothetical protein
MTDVKQKHAPVLGEVQTQDGGVMQHKLIVRLQQYRSLVLISIYKNRNGTRRRRQT